MPADIGNLAPDVYFPIEITSREYAGYLLLAARLAASGLNAVIGHKSAVKSLTHSAAAPGVVFYKADAREGFAPKGFAFVGQDPETGLPYQHYADFVARRPYSMQRLDTSAAYFCYGKDDYEYLTATNASSAQHIFPFGSPRTMLWGSHGDQFYAWRKEEIRTRYGPFVLVVSSGGRGSPVVARQLRRVSGVEQEYLRKRELLARGSADTLLGRARAIRDRTGLNVVIRPHPAESWVQWRRDVQSDDGIFVDSAYELGAWIRAAEFVVQSTKSTTAFETWLADTPSIADAPPTASLGDDGSLADFVTHELCLPYPDERDVGGIDSIRLNWANLKAEARPNELVERKLYSPPADATVEISAVIEGLVDRDRPSQVRGRAMDAITRGLRKPSWRRRRDREKLGRSEPPPFKKWTLHPADVARDLESAGKILGIDGDIRSHEILPNAFVVSRAA